MIGEILYILMGFATAVGMAALFVDAAPRVEVIEIVMLGLISILLGVVWPMTLMACVVGGIAMKINTVLDK